MGNLGEFERNVTDISLMLDGTGCQVLAFFFGKSEGGWQTYYLGSKTHLVSFISTYRSISVDLAEKTVESIFFKE
jgi:hypothetical protein